MDIPGNETAHGVPMSLCGQIVHSRTLLDSHFYGTQLVSVRTTIDSGIVTDGGSSAN